MKENGEFNNKCVVCGYESKGINIKCVRCGSTLAAKVSQTDYRDVGKSEDYQINDRCKGFDRVDEHRVNYKASGQHTDNSFGGYCTDCRGCSLLRACGKTKKGQKDIKTRAESVEMIEDKGNKVRY